VPKPVTDPATMSRLAFLRQLYQQGAEQSRLPEPLNATAVLSVHDASELFLVLAAEHLNASLPKHVAFMDYWKLLDPAKLPDGVALSGQQRMGRLNELRNGLKHRGTMPSVAAVTQACADVRAFLDDDTPSVFGIAFDSIDMAEVIPQPEVRGKVKAASGAETARDRTEAMGLLAEAYEKLFAPEPGRPRRASQTTGPTLSRMMREGDIRAALSRPDDSRLRRPAGATAGALASQIAEVTDAAAAIQRAVRVLALGIDYWQFDRFEQLTPHLIYFLSGDGERRYPPGYAPSLEEFEFCRQFVITAALRMAEAEIHAVRPSWESP
jgi:hypothetical protein